MILNAAPAGPTRSLLPPGRSAAEWHAALTAEIAGHLTPAHAAILAAPHPSAAGEQWETPATHAVRYLELPEADRDALRRALLVILSDIRRVAESGTAPTVAACWPALREIPDLNLLFAADGRPVLAGWGRIPAAAAAPPGLLAALDDGHAWRPRPRWPWGSWGAVGGTLAIALALLATWFVLLRTSVPACVVAPEELAALDAQARGDARHNMLMVELARLVNQQGRARLQCPIPQAPPNPLPQSHAEAPTGPALPLERWQHHDLAMFQGCWSRVSAMNVREEATDRILPVSSWRLCFDEQGNGTQTISLTDGHRCTGPVHAAFEGDRMVTTAGRCTGGFEFVRSEQDCTRVTDDEGHCSGRDLEGSRLGHRGQDSVFRR